MEQCLLRTEAGESGGSHGRERRRVPGEEAAGPGVEPGGELVGAEAEPRAARRRRRRRGGEREQHAPPLEVELRHLVEHLVAELDHLAGLAGDVDGLGVVGEIAELPARARGAPS